VFFNALIHCFVVPDAQCFRYSTESAYTYTLLLNLLWKLCDGRK